MALTSQATGDDWSVFTQGIPVDDSFCCEVHVAHGGPAGEFKHQFRNSKIFVREWVGGTRRLARGCGVDRPEARGTIHL
jgi:hypothetical protein